MIKAINRSDILGFLWCAGILFLCPCSYSQTLLSGTVLDDASSAPVAKATVALKAAGKGILTGDDGKFSLAANAGVTYNRPGRMASGKIKINNGMLDLYVPADNLAVEIVLYDLNGKLKSVVVKRKFDKGTHGIPLKKMVKSTGIEVIKWTMGVEQGAMRIIPGMCMKAGQFSRNPNRTSAVSSSVDTIVTDRYGYYSDIRNTSTPAENLTIRLKKMPQDSIVPPGMKLIDSCNFIMGSQKGDANETPEHEVALSPYFVDSTEVTQLDYEILVKARPWDNSSLQLPGGKGSYHPAWGVNWYDAVYYCNTRSKRDGLDTVYGYLAIIGTPGDGCTLDSVKTDFIKTGYRLLTEAEWEYAYGTGKQTAYLWGETGDSATYYSWISDNSGSTSHPAAQKLPNLFMLYDMGGNVYEWLNDCYRSNYPQTIQVNPTGPSSGSEKIHRGGAWNVRADFLRITRRFSGIPSTRAGLLGFRVALPKR